jgi:hypothetical protein
VRLSAYLSLFTMIASLLWAGSINASVKWHPHSQNIVKEFKDRCGTISSFMELYDRAKAAGLQEIESQKAKNQYGKYFSAQDAESRFSAFQKRNLLIFIFENQLSEFVDKKTGLIPKLVGCEVYDMQAKHTINPTDVRTVFGPSLTPLAEIDHSREKVFGSVLKKYKFITNAKEIEILSQFVTSEFLKNNPRLQTLPGLGLRTAFVNKQ